MARTLVRINFNQFFDRKAVTGALSRAERQVLSKAGAFVRKRARTSIRKRKAISGPGRPPSSHQGDYRRSIFFGYEPENRSVVIGPRADFGPASSSLGPRVPELLEFGGTTMRRGKPATYRARPHMGPALEAEAPNFPSLWANSVKG